MIVATVGITILILSVIGAVIWARRSARAEQPTQVKVLMFFLYFWILAFLQLMAATVVYMILRD